MFTLFVPVQQKIFHFCVYMLVSDWYIGHKGMEVDLINVFLFLRFAKSETL